VDFIKNPAGKWSFRIFEEGLLTKEAFKKRNLQKLSSHCRLSTSINATNGSPSPPTLLAKHRLTTNGNTFNLAAWAIHCAVAFALPSPPQRHGRPPDGFT
jgi:hypothetical protein